MKIGKYLENKGLLKENQITTILKEQEKDKNKSFLRKRFGRIAVDKGYITEKALNYAMMEKYQVEDDQVQKKDNPKYSFLIK